MTWATGFPVRKEEASTLPSSLAGGSRQFDSAQGRATRIVKGMSHITVVVSDGEES